jgi:DnaK suppressor protein
MNKLNTQKFMSLFNDLLSDRHGNNLHNLNNSLPSYAKLEGQGDEVDLVNSQKEQLLNLRLNGRNMLFLKKVEKAKQRILDGTFGVCEDCGMDISQKRLIARPTATMCISCQEEKERSEKSIFKHRRDLKLIKNVSEAKDGDEIISSGPKKINTPNDIKFESVVEM